MTGQLHPPLLTPAQATNLLDQVLYEQVLECVDLDALYRLEQSLVMLVGELDGIDDARITETATAMLDRALLRLPGDVRGYLHASGWPFKGCELCEEEARDNQARAAEARAGETHPTAGPPRAAHPAMTGDVTRAARRRPS